MQHILNVLEKADTYDLVGLDEMKQMLMIPASDTSKDAMLTAMISTISETVAKMQNRVFAKEKVRETIYQLEDGDSRRIYLSRWPVKLVDIESITRDDTYDVLLDEGNGWTLEEETGTLYRYPPGGAWYGVTEIVYSGGYELPEEAPGPLKFALAGVLRESYMAWVRNPSLYGIRQLGHKEARVSYYQPDQISTLGSPDTWRAVQSVLDAKYTRFWV